MKWIPLSERKPPQPKDITDVNKYYCSLKNGQITVVEYAHTTSGYHEFIWNNDFSDSIEYWLEPKLPPLPKKEMCKEDILIKRLDSGEAKFGELIDFLRIIFEILKTKADK